MRQVSQLCAELVERVGALSINRQIEAAMKAELKSLHSPDIDLVSFVPPDPLRFRFLLQAMIGSEGEEAADTFDLEVCTPGWLLDRHLRGEAEEVIIGLHTILVFSYDLPRIRGAIERYCSRCVGDDWASLARQLSRLGAWEFEDYR